MYNNKNNYSDPLGIVELVYEDFEYTNSIFSLIRSMPSDELGLGTKNLNEERLYKRWRLYLENSQSVSKSKIDILKN
ncbi:DUF2247 family protein [Haloplasma contractile]|uniref:DUF2247 family protein n=1 Tax=Haloplasma contractile TaxID=471825 RepID=UPI0038B9F7C8